MRKGLLPLLGAAVALLCGSNPLYAQDNYEIQVYGSALVPVGATMVEVHSNFTTEGRRAIEDGVSPTNHALHETLEITHGFSDWFETAIYTFTSAHSGGGWEWVGNHVRPRLAVPARLGWPVGVSLSQEIGYQRRKFSEDTWSWEIRPIIDKQMGAFYWSFNPTLERSLGGANKHQGFEFAPNAQISYNFSPRINGALEYYGALGPLSGFDSRRDQEHQIIPSLNLNVSPDWEINIGVAKGLTPATDHYLVKTIIGRRFGR